LFKFKFLSEKHHPNNLTLYYFDPICHLSKPNFIGGPPLLGYMSIGAAIPTRDGTVIYKATN